jgi:ATP-dependent RNA helicase DeaD
MNTFAQLGLPLLLERALEEIKFTEPTSIQQKAIPLLLAKNDLIAQAETGSGKTAAFVVPILAHLLNNPGENALILSPTRELAQQIGQFVSELTHFFKPFHSVNLVGGSDIRKQFKVLQKKPRVIIATPGRLLDHLKRNTVQIHKVQHLVLDEGDRMIDMGFAPQLNEILKYLPDERHTSFFTATLNKSVQELCRKYLVNPTLLKMESQSKPVSKIRQSMLQVTLKQKDEKVLDEINRRSGSIIIFLKTKHRTDRLSQYLTDYGLNVGLIHGGRTQGQRNKAITAFKQGKTRILCATDVAARGLDVPHIEHVINFDLPMMDEDYVHRVGRTARNGADGEALSFVTPEESHQWNRLVKKYSMELPLLSVERGSRREKPSRGFAKKKSSSGGGGPRRKFNSGGNRRRKKAN